ncbi:MAG TPA: C-terminal helicase domain-containing protein [Thermoanaerobaculia bacterium]|nr:C-terminal helicase domain-containing protein [Thermoanaerobaculia bacterium]
MNQLDRADAYTSGKWELFKEILEEALGSGQKVVVFTQYLGMIELMRRHLESAGVGHAILTGATTDRGGVVDRFNRDPGCRVFLGSLKAGGTGIDLVGGSVVIHYDRWWNAAREDQATDRVYRLGQKRAVQVFKLVTEGTLEEKISALIDRKRRMMESVVQEDDPKLAKIFTRDELLEMLRGE